MPAPASFLVAPDGVRLAWDAAGSGPAVLFLHGIGSSRRRWDAHVEAVARAGFRAVRYDMRGFGDSDPSPGPCEMVDFVRDLDHVVAALDLAPMHLVGHSLGGMVAMAWAVRRPDALRSLALASTTSHNGRRATAFARAMVVLADRGFEAAVGEPGVRPEIDRALVEAFPGVPVPIEMLRRGVEEPNPSRANAWRATVGFSVKDDLGKLRCPVLVLHGSADPLIPCAAGRLLHEAVPGSTWIEIAGCGHSLPTQAEAEFRDALLRHLRGATT